MEKEPESCCNWGMSIWEVTVLDSHVFSAFGNFSTVQNKQVKSEKRKKQLTREKANE